MTDNNNALLTQHMTLPRPWTPLGTGECQPRSTRHNRVDDGFPQLPDESDR